LPPIIEPGSEKSSTPLASEVPTPAGVNDSDRLFDRLRSLTDKKVDTAARQVNKFSEDDDANEKRWAKAETRRTFYKIRRWFFWFLFGLVCFVATVCSIGYIALVCFWLSNVVWGTPLKNPTALKDIITSVLWTVLVIFATLFGETVFKEKDS